MFRLPLLSQAGNSRRLQNMPWDILFPVFLVLLLGTTYQPDLVQNKHVTLGHFRIAVGTIKAFLFQASVGTNCSARMHIMWYVHICDAYRDIKGGKHAAYCKPYTCGKCCSLLISISGSSATNFSLTWTVAPIPYQAVPKAAMIANILLGCSVRIEALEHGFLKWSMTPPGPEGGCCITHKSICC